MTQTSSNYFRLGISKNWNVRTFDDRGLNATDTVKFIKLFFYRRHRFFRKVGLTIHSIIVSKKTVELYMYWASTISEKLRFLPRCMFQKIFDKFFETRIFIKCGRTITVKSKIIDRPSASSILTYFRILTRLRHPSKLNKKIIPRLKNLKELIGFKTVFSGRFSRDQMAIKEIFKFGSVPTSTISKDVDYAFETIRLRNSLCGMKVWAYFKHVNVRKKNFEQ